MPHLESLIAEYLAWRGFIVVRNKKVGRLPHGGWEGELDIVGFHTEIEALVHYEPSLDAYSWPRREALYEKKFQAGRKYIFLGTVCLVAKEYETGASRGSSHPTRGATRSAVAGFNPLMKLSQKSEH